MTAMMKQIEGVAVASAPQEAAGYPPPKPVASLLLPAPPSTNVLFKNVRGKGRVKTASYNDWKSHAGWSLQSQEFTRIDEPCVALVAVERHSLQADIDNRNKAILDLLVDHGVIRDDSLVTAIFSVWNPKANHMCRVQVFPCQPMSLTFHPSQDGASGAVFINAPFHDGDA